MDMDGELCVCAIRYERKEKRGCVVVVLNDWVGLDW